MESFGKPLWATRHVGLFLHLLPYCFVPRVPPGLTLWYYFLNSRKRGPSLRGFSLVNFLFLYFVRY